ncbi:MAG: GTPase HflX [Acidobacteriota bacterium]
MGIVHPGEFIEDTQDHLNELDLLADTAGGRVQAVHIQDRKKPDPAYYIGRGKAEEIALEAKAKGIDAVIFDDDLTPAQVKNLEKIIESKVLDRSTLILDIFARRAKTREAMTQVELAQLRHLLPRLTRRWTHLSRQVGGIGTRGVGETQLEIDRRIIKNKIARLTKDLNKIERGRQERRKSRDSIFKVAIIGYTNAGKTSLFNAFTESHAFVQDRLFATLDSMVRRCILKGNNEILLIDTVGFIRKLPIPLIASFRSTLEESVFADLLMNVIDLSNPNYEEHLAVTENIKLDLGIIDRPCLKVFNKIDLVEEGIIERARRLYPNALFVSALKSQNLESIERSIFTALNQVREEVDLYIDPRREDIIALVYRSGEVLEKTYVDGHVHIRFKGTKDKARQIQHIVEMESACE